jgi:hypothetical protein
MTSFSRRNFVIKTETRVRSQYNSPNNNICLVYYITFHETSGKKYFCLYIQDGMQFIQQTLPVTICLNKKKATESRDFYNQEVAYGTPVAACIHTRGRENDSENNEEEIRKAVVHYSLRSISTRVSH